MKSFFSSYRSQWVALLGLISFGGAFYLIDSAFHSDQFLIEEIEVHSPDLRVISPKSVEILAAVPLGKVRLIEVNLDQVEKNLMRHPWIESVLLTKVFPKTLKIDIKIKKAVAVLQNEEGVLRYVDASGNAFGEVSFDRPIDLPVLLGNAWSSQERLKKAVQFLENWQLEQLDDFVELSALRYDSERGFVGVTLYRTSEANEPVRTLLEFGQRLGTSTFNRFRSLRQVYQYLVEHTKIAKKVLVLNNKKIVVRTDRRS